MFCTNCGKQGQNNDRFCSGCGKDLMENNIIEKETTEKAAKPPSFFDYAKRKSESWFKKVKPNQRKAKKPVDVVINIGILGWHTKTGMLKPVRGKRVALRLSEDAEYDDILKAGKKRMSDFYPDDVDIDELYYVAFENGSVAYFIPGTTTDFVLSKYKIEIGKDYKSITLYLMSDADKTTLEKIKSNFDSNDGNDNFDLQSPAKKSKDDLYELYVPQEEDFSYYGIPNFQLTETNMDGRQDVGQANMQESLHRITEEPSSQGTSSAEVEAPQSPHCISNCLQDEPSTSGIQGTYSASVHQPQCISSSHLEEEPSTPVPDPPSLSTQSILQELFKKVNMEDHFFLAIQRNFQLNRVLTLWGRQKKQSPENRLMVKFLGEDGIDSGALSREFFTLLMKSIGEEFFPGGAPKDSMSDIQNCNFFFCGQMIAASLVQGGPPPLFLHKSVYSLLVNINENRYEHLSQEDFTDDDQSLFETIKESPADSIDLILENGYTGLIHKDQTDAILHTVMINIMTRRRAYLTEIIRGLNLFGLYDKVVENKEIMKSLFVPSNNNKEDVDANYLLSIIHPDYSPIGSTKRNIEEKVVNFLQDFIYDIENEVTTPPTSNEVAALKESIMIETNEESENDVITPDLTVKGILGWLTGQKHRPLFGEKLHIPVRFDHDCFVRFPKHTICFPRIHACSKEFSIPVNHCKSFEEFKTNFSTAYFNAQAFGVS